jgi:hypothetical protein
MPRLLSAVIAGTAVLLLTGDACAGTEELEGLGFRARPPLGFRVAGREDGAHGSRRTCRKIVPEGELVLTYLSEEQSDTQVARTEMAVGRMVEPLPTVAGRPPVRPQVQPASVDGAEDAFEVVLRDPERIERALSARQGAIVVHMTLSAPVAAEAEADDVWRAAMGSLRLEWPGAGVGTVVVWILVALIILAVLVTIVKRSGRKAGPLPRPPFFHVAAPASQDAHVPASTPPAVPREPAAPEFPGTTADPRPAGPGFSRAEDGLPVFSPEEKAAGVSIDTVRRRPTPIRAAPVPTQAPGPVPLSRPPSPRPPLPAVKVTKT